jgi:hypothetical protein
MAYQKIISDLGYYHFVRVTLQQQSLKILSLPNTTYIAIYSIKDACGKHRIPNLIIVKLLLTKKIRVILQKGN